MVRAPLVNTQPQRCGRPHPPSPPAATVTAAAAAPPPLPAAALGAGNQQSSSVKGPLGSDLLVEGGAPSHDRARVSKGGLLV